MWEAEGGWSWFTIFITTVCIKEKFSHIHQITSAANFQQGFWQTEQELFLAMEILSSVMLGSPGPSMVNDRNGNVPGTCSDKHSPSHSAFLHEHLMVSPQALSLWKQWEIINAFMDLSGKQPQKSTSDCVLNPSWLIQTSALRGEGLRA